MGIVHRSHRTDIDWLADGPIGPYVDAFKQYLTERGYAANTFASYLGGIAHFAQWARSGACGCNGSTKRRSPSSLTSISRIAVALVPFAPRPR